MPLNHTRILALDIATTTGYAHDDGFGEATFDGHTTGRKLHQFGNWLADMLTTVEPDLVAYERPFIHRSIAATQLLQRFVGQAEVTCHVHERLCLAGPPPATLKKWFTGSGRASKDDMLAEARRRGFDVQTDNAADAVALHEWLKAKTVVEAA